MSGWINFRDVTRLEPSSWQGKRILSFDVDWASDTVLADLLDLLENAAIRATIFITHNTPLLERMRANPLLELGIHPNFDPLFQQQPGADDPNTVIKKLKELVPEARVVRSHSMTHSGRLLMLFQAHGFQHTSQFFTNHSPAILPIRHINGLTEVPVFFADDGLVYESDEGQTDLSDFDALLAPNQTSVQVFNFHPIHVFLNTNSFAYYSKMKHSPETAEVQKGYGVREMLKTLLNQNTQ